MLLGQTVEEVFADDRSGLAMVGFAIAILRSLGDRYRGQSHSPKPYPAANPPRQLKWPMLQEGSSFSANRTGRSAVIGFWRLHLG